MRREGERGIIVDESKKKKKKKKRTGEGNGECKRDGGKTCGRGSRERERRRRELRGKVEEKRKEFRW